MSRFTLGIEVGAVVLGKTFQRMPLHCTLIHWFCSDREPSEIERCVIEAAMTQPKTVLRSLGPSLFGPDKNIPVHILEKNRELEDLHMNIFNALNDLLVTFTHPAYVGPEYKPHISDSEGAYFFTGSEMLAERIYLVEAITNNKPPLKIVRSIIPLP